MYHFIEYLKKERIIEELKEFYIKNFKSRINNNLLDKIIKNIQELKIVNNLEKGNFDIFGDIYEKIIDYEIKKVLGEFYTPSEIVEYILDVIGYKPSKNIISKRIIDLSCGSGSFLVQAIRILIEFFKRYFNRKEIKNFSNHEAKIIINSVKNNIFGNDINPIACILCQINMYFELYEIFRKIRKTEKDFRMPFFNIFNLNALILNIKNNYDFVVGNPPYLFIRAIPKDHKSILDKLILETNKGQYDYYQIFIELGVRYLKNGGKLGYIIPDSLLALSNRSIIRKYIYKNTKIREIYYTGPRFKNSVVSNVILILEKESSKNKRENNIIKVKIDESRNKYESELKQEILKSWNYNFLINLNQKDITLIDYLSKNFHKIKDLNEKGNFKILLSRGVELSKSGKIIFCDKCKKFLPIPKGQFICPKCFTKLNEKNIEEIIQRKVPKTEINNFKLFIYSINRYQIKEYRYININKNGINYKDLEIYNNQIVIRQIGENGLICAALNDKFALTSQSFYNLKIFETPIREFNNLYLLALINSKLLSYYFIKSFGSYKKLFPRILIEKINILPIKIPESNTEREFAQKIIELTKNLLKNNFQEKNKIEQIQNEIDSYIFNLYQINYEDRNYIVNYMKSLF